MLISTPTVVAPGVTARPLSTGFVAVDLHYSADPEAFTPEVIAAERAGMPGWRWRAEYELDWSAQAGQPVFDGEWLDWQQGHLADPIARLRWCPDREIRFEEDDHGQVLIWGWPNEQPADLPGDLIGLRRSVGFGIDVGEGVGQSDSTIVGFWVDNRQQCVEFASNTIKPTDLGRLAADLARYFNDALICCVRRMHGVTVLRSIFDEAGYTRLWRSEQHDRSSRVKAEQYGWPGGEATSPYLFGRWMDALQHRQVRIRSLTTLQQHRQYIYDEAGRITHQALADMPVDVRERHGDLVIACALAWRACCDMPRHQAAIEHDKLNPWTWMGQRLIREQGKADDGRWS
jgi:hypothetical protein